MKRLVVPFLTFGCLILMASESKAFGHRCWCYCPPPPCAPPAVSYVDQVVTCYRPEWKEEKVKCVVNKIYCRVQEETVKCTVMVPRWVDVKQTCVYLVPVPRVVEREVVCCRMVPVQSVDPCTGCAYTCFRPEEYRQRVQCTVWDCKQESREIICKVCRPEAQVREVKQQRIIPECRPETVETVRRYCVMVPYQATIRVPVCQPCCP